MVTMRRLLADQSGIVLVLSLLIIALLLGGGIGAIVSMQTDFKSSGNLRSGMQTFYIADAGVNHALQQVSGAVSPNFDSLLAASNGTLVVQNNSFYSGSYTVTRQGSASSPDRIKLVAVATGLSNSRAQVEAWFRKDAGKSPKAVVSNGDLEINGNPDLMGVCGGAHSNDDMRITGNPGIQMAAGLTSSNAGGGGSLPEGMNITGTPCVGSTQCSESNPPDEYELRTGEQRNNYETANGSAATETIPTINPASYATKVAAQGSAGNHYILNDNGTVTTGGTCGTDGLCSGGTIVTTPPGWAFSGGQWVLSGNIAGIPLGLLVTLPLLGDSAANGVYYSETAVNISGSPGSDAAPWRATIIARDSITISGNPNIAPFPSPSTDLQNHLLVTGNDLVIAGTSDMTAESWGGAILVHQQFSISGAAKINGFIIAADGIPTWTGDPFPSPSAGPISSSSIPGDPTITYSCDTNCTGPACPPPTINVVSWSQKF